MLSRWILARPKFTIACDVFRSHLSFATKNLSPITTFPMQSVCPTQDFALGDFDDTPIAKMEQEKEAAASGVGELDASARGSVEEEEGVKEGGGVVVQGAARPKKPSKPLIEEL